MIKQTPGTKSTCIPYPFLNGDEYLPVEEVASRFATLVAYNQELFMATKASLPVKGFPQLTQSEERCLNKPVFDKTSLISRLEIYDMLAEVRAPGNVQMYSSGEMLHLREVWDKVYELYDIFEDRPWKRVAITLMHFLACPPEVAEYALRYIMLENGLTSTFNDPIMGLGDMWWADYPPPSQR